jgi:carboxyl-terminal processing protease
VILTVARDGFDDPIVFNLMRERIHVASVRHKVIEPGVAYLRISQFTDSTREEVEDALEAASEALDLDEPTELHGVVLDLRDNPGGILDAAVDVSDLFLQSGVIVTADGRTPEARFSREAHPGDVLDGATLVVLVNNGSASASEIVAGALHDHGRATIVGTATFGKGLVQTVMPLSRGRAIKLTTSRYYTPSGASIQGTGIAPDVLVESAQSDDGEDLQLNEAVQLVTAARTLHSRAP